MITYPTPESLEHHPVVPRDQWLIARTELLKKEKELTRLRDEISSQRRDLPWVRVEKNYVFQGPHGPETLARSGRKVAMAVRSGRITTTARTCISPTTT